jgi:hypothetical protein
VFLAIHSFFAIALIDVCSARYNAVAADRHWPSPSNQQEWT